MWTLVMSQSREICERNGPSQPLSAACLHIDGEMSTEPAWPLGATYWFHRATPTRISDVPCSSRQEQDLF
jgi:hypothetical protein